MRLALLILGSVLLMQVILGALRPMFQVEFSFEKLGAAIDHTKLTTGLCAVTLARILKRSIERDTTGSAGTNAKHRYFNESKTAAKSKTSSDVQ